MNLNKWFGQIAETVSHAAGHAVAFIICCIVVIVWLVSGPAFGFSDTWQLVINTGTTIVTFLMVFLIQNTQNRDSEALQLKLDELIYSMDAARNETLDLEELEEEELDRLRENYEKLAEDARQRLRSRRSGGTPQPPSGDA